MWYLYFFGLATYHLRNTYLLQNLEIIMCSDNVLTYLSTRGSEAYVCNPIFFSFYWAFIFLVAYLRQLKAWSHVIQKKEIAADKESHLTKWVSQARLPNVTKTDPLDVKCNSPLRYHLCVTSFCFYKWRFAVRNIHLWYWSVIWCLGKHVPAVIAITLVHNSCQSRTEDLSSSITHVTARPFNFFRKFKRHF